MFSISIIFTATKEVHTLKIAVFSDSHGDVSTMERAVNIWQPDLILHLGDHASDADSLAARTGIPTRRVRGNCDLASRAPDSDLFELGGLRIMMCHGHRFGVKDSLDPLISSADFSKADILLYGHTHQSHIERIGRMLVINPGSSGTGLHTSWVKLTIADGEAAAELVSIV